MSIFIRRDLGTAQFGLSGQKSFSYHICYENLLCNSLCKEECDKWLNKWSTFAQDFKGGRKIKRTAYQNLDDLQTLLIKLTDVHGEKRSMETGVLLIKMAIAHFTLANLKTLKFKRVNLNYDAVTLKIIEEESQCQKKCCGY